jgi:hypothetical protein
MFGRFLISAAYLLIILQGRYQLLGALPSIVRTCLLGLFVLAWLVGGLLATRNPGPAADDGGLRRGWEVALALSP